MNELHGAQAPLGRIIGNIETGPCKLVFLPKRGPGKEVPPG